jgi:hypothetical protein
MSREHLVVEKKLYNEEANLKYILARFGDYLAEKHNYRENRGMDAVRFHLMQKHNWTP